MTEPSDETAPERGQRDDAPVEAHRVVDAVSRVVLGGGRDLDGAEVAKAAGVRRKDAEAFWTALGFAGARTTDKVFTQKDVEALEQVVSLVRRGRLTEAEALSVTRALGRSADHLAWWQTQVVAEAWQERVRDADGEADQAVDHEQALRAAVHLSSLAPEVEPLLQYAFRRHLTHSVSRMVADSLPDTGRQGLQRTIGFVDMVSFTAVVRELSERDLSFVVQRFESMASDVVASHGGRVVKTIGDEVFFQTHDPRPAADIALELLEVMADDPYLPAGHAALAHGRVMQRMGDVYGTTVNRASRLVEHSGSGEVVVDRAVADLLAPLTDVVTTSRGTVDLAGLGEEEVLLLTRGEHRHRARP